MRVYRIIVKRSLALDLCYPKVLHRIAQIIFLSIGLIFALSERTVIGSRGRRCGSFLPHLTVH
ncbi:MAG: hypothetical protein H0U54_02750 [Acidobacteria bacterium]|nr:hypothetical protein [Acidobacteriota bacterium]